MIIVNGFQKLTIITKCFILHVEAVLDPPLPTSMMELFCENLLTVSVNIFSAAQKQWLFSFPELFQSDRGWVTQS